MAFALNGFGFYGSSGSRVGGGYGWVTDMPQNVKSKRERAKVSPGSLRLFLIPCHFGLPLLLMLQRPGA